jgi:transcription antitermination factor NusG
LDGVWFGIAFEYNIPNEVSEGLMANIKEDFYSAAKFVFVFYLMLFIAILLLTAATAIFLIYKEKKETKEILVYIEQTYVPEKPVKVVRGYYEGCEGQIVNLDKKDQFAAQVDLKNCKGDDTNVTSIKIREFDEKVQGFWLRHPFFVSDLIFG